LHASRYPHLKSIKKQITNKNKKQKTKTQKTKTQKTKNKKQKTKNKKRKTKNEKQKTKKQNLFPYSYPSLSIPLFSSSSSPPKT
jgi:hypothetical protein